MIEYKVTVLEDGTNEWYLNGKLHREDGPAVEFANGDKFWHRNSMLHREDGPAIEYANGDKFWHRNSMLHREDGPAVEYANGTKKWYLNGMSYTQEDFLLKTQPVLELTLDEIATAFNINVNNLKIKK